MNSHKKNVAVIGIGGIGLRHLQSCANLPNADYDIYAVDLSPENLAKAEKLIDNPFIKYLVSIDLLPAEIDVAIVATQSNVRAEVTRQLVEKKSIKALVLEKVLFQKIEDYERINLLLEESHIKGFVNCPRRLWPVYKTLKKELENEGVTEITVKGSSWDIGCNGIHYIDFIGFLLNSDCYHVTHFRPAADFKESKRAGTLFIDGELEGVFDNNCRFLLSTLSSHDAFKEIKIVLKNGLEIMVRETATLVELYRDNQLIQSDKIPFQSELTEGTVRELCAKNTCDLASYKESKNLHLPFVVTVFDYLKKSQPELEGCPIT